MSESILDLSASAPPAELAADVCIVGSGSAGATAAWVLAEAGLRVVVLEEGGDFTGAKLTQRDSEMYDQLYMERGGRATADLSIQVLQGRVLGGGGVINACDVVPVPEGVWRHWQRVHGLSELSPEAMAPYAARALTDLSANHPDEALWSRGNLLLRQGAEALGMQGEAMLCDRQGCAGLGTCLLGCPLDAKQSPRLVAVERARSAGARFVTRARAVRVAGRGGARRVHVRALDAMGYHERGALSVRARVVVLAANAVATPQLLLRSGLGNTHVGRNLMLQPQLPIVAFFEQRVDAFRGIPQAYAITQFEHEDDREHGLWGFRIEAIMGTPGIVSTLLPWVGEASVRAMGQYAHLAASLLLTPDAPSGRVALHDDGRPLITYDHADEHKARFRQAAREAARVYLAAGATRVMVPSIPALEIRSEGDLDLLDSLAFKPATTPILSAHQQGTVRMASSAAHGAAAPDGKLYGEEGVYVFDTSLYPSSASSHTMTPAITISRYLAEQLATTLRA